jgi:hypothetical protein
MNFTVDSKHSYSEKFVINIQISSVLQSNLLEIDYFLSIIDQQYSDHFKELNL